MCGTATAAKVRDISGKTECNVRNSNGCCVSESSD
jgi:hypothetical protein